MNETKEALKTIAFQLNALTITVAALERIATKGMSGHDYTELRSQFEQANQQAFDKLMGLIETVPGI